MEEEVYEAEIVEERRELAVSWRAGEISANFDALEARVDAILADYEGWEPSAGSASDVRQCAAERKYLNGLAKQLDERRKAVKEEYTRPLAAFEARANGIRDKIKATAARLKAVEDMAAQAEKDAKFSKLQEAYEAYAGVLCDLVPFERVLDPKWLNKSTSVKKALGEMESRVDGIAEGWEALKGMGLENAAQAEAEFFRTLDLGAAVALDARVKADAERIEAAKACMPQPAAEPMPQPEPQAVSEPSPRFEESFVYLIAVEATDAQKSKITDALRGVGVHGRVVRTSYPSVDAALAHL